MSQNIQISKNYSQPEINRSQCHSSSVFPQLLLTSICLQPLKELLSHVSCHSCLFLGAKRIPIESLIKNLFRSIQNYIFFLFVQCSNCNDLLSQHSEFDEDSSGNTVFVTPPLHPPESDQPSSPDLRSSFSSGSLGNKCIPSSIQCMRVCRLGKTIWQSD